MKYIYFTFFILFLLSGSFASSQEALKNTPETSKGQCSTRKYGAPICIRKEYFEDDLCAALLTISKRHGVNTNFFTRLIWQESRFNPNALSHANAQGIAQFIPSTAKFRGLSDPWNPAEALDESARYIARLIRKFGNEGLAAAAYNAGEIRVKKYIEGKRGLPNETRNYVQIITDINAKKWVNSPPKNKSFRLSPNKDFLPACLDLAKKRIYTKYKPLTHTKPKPWGVQLAAGATKAKARKSYKRRAASCKVLLRRKSVQYIYKRSAYRSGKKIYHARIGFNKRSLAAAFCTRLKQSGCSCAVYKN